MRVSVWLNRYLIMFDKCGHASEDGLERREPIRRLLGNVEQCLCAVYYPTSLYCENINGISGLRSSAICTHTHSDRGYSQKSRDWLNVAF